MLTHRGINTYAKTLLAQMTASSGLWKFISQMDTEMYTKLALLVST